MEPQYDPPKTWEHLYKDFVNHVWGTFNSVPLRRDAKDNQVLSIEITRATRDPVALTNH